uniref:NADH dehydrogenase subunit 3 n=1 Tax=Falcolipeurus marginalis TaxID=236517 RepID=UPI00211DC84A|nr:NADH dehydrogenase subunit 3 [Falcolipeurus marginalis]UTT72602.1 NADH dehydrogenase subunit 3 [Falcolipeurus marginalis]
MLISLIFLFSYMFYSFDSSVSSNDPFECGFNEMSMSRTPICLHFFMIGILFLVFDIEMIVCLPLMFMMFNSYFLWSLSWYFLTFILLVGLLLEVFLGSLDWKEEN